MILFSSQVAGRLCFFGVAPATAILRCGPFPLALFLISLLLPTVIFSRGARGRASFWPLRSVRFGHVSFWGFLCTLIFWGPCYNGCFFRPYFALISTTSQAAKKNSSTKLSFLLVLSARQKKLECGESFYYTSADNPLTSADSSGSTTRC